ncbi:MAG: tRNA (adenosine(37)-N6)-dimethylallyltransferase MiaA [Micrococcales bacterium]|nr:tRNA (adenosine(37)-N6)-dimethylallyltransferase MiaA [Micrococcales bacterium]
MMPVIAVVGPTASGKSDLGLALAERIGGEVINADSMQLYRGMDIGTAKLTVSERRGVPHHQLDVLDVTQEASVARYQRAARADVDAIRARGNVPVFVGGSGLYIRAALDRLDIPPTDPKVRAAIEAEATEQGAPAVYARLRAADPEAARHIQPNNVRRVVRAIEVIELTGMPFSATMPTRRFVTPAVMLGLRLEQAALDDRIERRVERMWEQGLQAETKRLLHHGLRDGATASHAIGYRQAIAVLDAVIGGVEARDDTAQATRRFARRQQAWFRRDPRIAWLDALAPDVLDEAIRVIRQAIPDIESGRLREDG